jgi:hypothetical protein
MLSELHDFQQFRAVENVTVDHVNDFEFVLMQLIVASGTTIFYHDHIKTLIGQAAHRR